jgi:hypothetical protein
VRTTLTLDDRVVRDLKEIAHRSGKPFKVVVNETLEAGLTAGQQRPKAKRYRVRPASLGGLRKGIDLDKALALSDSLEDVELIRKLESRK